MIRSGLCSLGPVFGVLAAFAIPSVAAAKKAVISKTVASKTSTIIGCRPARGPVATTICASPEYRAMEREIAALTDRAKTQLSPGEKSQLVESAARFVRQRNGCAWAAHNSAHPGSAIDECVRASLEGRVKRLRDVVERKSSDVSSR